jgi:hypothetical protein
MPCWELVELITEYLDDGSRGRSGSILGASGQLRGVPHLFQPVPSDDTRTAAQGVLSPETQNALFSAFRNWFRKLPASRTADRDGQSTLVTPGDLPALMHA